jgi:hypothetical protein
MGLRLGCTSPQEQGNEEPEGHGLIWLDVPNKNEGKMLQKTMGKQWQTHPVTVNLQSRHVCTLH